MNIEVTDTAKDKILTMIKDTENDGIRLRVIGGGCNGLQYKLEFEKEVTDEDVVCEYGIENVKLYVDIKSLLYVNNLVLDYDGGLNGNGFRFENESAKNQCGCGESFSV